MDRNKALDKIAKCLRLGKSSNSHEAASALRQAQKLMEQFQITEDEVNGSTVADDLVGFKERRRETIPIYAQALVNLVRAAMGVHAVFTDRMTGRHVRLAVRYFGPDGRVKMAVHAHAVLARAMHQEWLKYKEANPWAEDRVAFYLGWLNAVNSEVDAYGISEDEEAAIESKLVAKYGKELSTAKSRNRRLNEEEAYAGHQAGSNFKLHRPMERQQQYLTKE